MGLSTRPPLNLCSCLGNSRMHIHILRVVILRMRIQHHIHVLCNVTLIMTNFILNSS